MFDDLPIESCITIHDFNGASKKCGYMQAFFKDSNLQLALRTAAIRSCALEAILAPL